MTNLLTRSDNEYKEDFENRGMMDLNLATPLGRDLTLLKYRSGYLMMDVKRLIDALQNLDHGRAMAQISSIEDDVHKISMDLIDAGYLS